ncbi:hypothetical protein GGTG_08047 [Gaeumannomyces tritici R3-111a-1]|uniref:Uncharacterized protein n=1 Tax=Gaeumannomyces tritici (strain R3-111a-1) TaxID=644352 RepID=J3P3G1_GAET3|nr:hypothetical protein GGTG_08047 [Gaeumannomyces tritici R3-111a-1]EJT74203.1 hypothetical protein GGTG_08047 [Gaeumannomyces tritici R3-111a-1]
MKVVTVINLSAPVPQERGDQRGDRQAPATRLATRQGRWELGPWRETKRNLPNETADKMMGEKTPRKHTALCPIGPGAGHSAKQPGRLAGHTASEVGRKRRHKRSKGGVGLQTPLSSFLGRGPVSPLPATQQPLVIAQHRATAASLQPACSSLSPSVPTLQAKKQAHHHRPPAKGENPSGAREFLHSRLPDCVPPCQRLPDCGLARPWSKKGVMMQGASEGENATQAKQQGRVTFVRRRRQKRREGEGEESAATVTWFARSALERQTKEPEGNRGAIPAPPSQPNLAAAIPKPSQGREGSGGSGPGGSGPGGSGPAVQGNATLQQHSFVPTAAIVVTSQNPPSTQSTALLLHHGTLGGLRPASNRGWTKLQILAQRRHGGEGWETTQPRGPDWSDASATVRGLCAATRVLAMGGS